MHGRRHGADTKGFGTDDTRSRTKPRTLLPPTPLTREQSPDERRGSQGADKLPRDTEHRWETNGGSPRSLLHVPPWDGSAGQQLPGHSVFQFSLVSRARGTARPSCSSAGRRAANAGCFIRAALSNPCRVSQASSIAPGLGTGGTLQGRATSKSSPAATKALKRALFGAGCDGKAPPGLTQPRARGGSP